MNFSIKCIGKRIDGAAQIIELTVLSNNFKTTQDVTNSNGLVNIELIEQLENIIVELKNQNSIINKNILNDVI